MAGKPGSPDEAEAARRWAEKNVKHSESRLVKAQRAYIPREDDIDYEEGSE